MSQPNGGPMRVPEPERPTEVAAPPRGLESPDLVEPTEELEPAEELEPTRSAPELPPLTGDDAVDRAVRELAAAVGRPLDEQVVVIDAVHQVLQERLAESDG